MSGGPGSGASPGLCARCAHARVVETRTGSRFWLCQRSRTDAAFPRYPRLPVLRCAGFEEAARGVTEGKADQTTKEGHERG